MSGLVFGPPCVSNRARAEVMLEQVSYPLRARRQRPASADHRAADKPARPRRHSRGRARTLFERLMLGRRTGARRANAPRPRSSLVCADRGSRAEVQPMSPHRGRRSVRDLVAKYPDVSAHAQQIVDQRRAGVDHVLTVVQNQQQSLIAQRLRERLLKGPCGSFPGRAARPRGGAGPGQAPRPGPAPPLSATHLDRVPELSGQHIPIAQWARQQDAIVTANYNLAPRAPVGGWSGPPPRMKMR
jgi:hypothetical protein